MKIDDLEEFDMFSFIGTKDEVTKTLALCYDIIDASVVLTDEEMQQACDLVERTEQTD